MQLLEPGDGGPPPTLTVVQLPQVAGARWGALPFASDADRVGSRLSLVLDQPAAPATTVPWYGLCVDEWWSRCQTPSRRRVYRSAVKNPGAEAAQAVLLAVAAPGQKGQWDLDTLIDTLTRPLISRDARGGLRACWGCWVSCCPRFIARLTTAMAR